MMKVLMIMFVVAFSLIYTQNLEGNLLDESYDSIAEKIKASEDSYIQQKVLLAAYLKKARIEQDWKHIVKGYKKYLYHVPMELKLTYADSVIYSALLSKNQELITSAYLTKGLSYYWQKNHVAALDYYVTANNYYSECTNCSAYLGYKIKYNFGLIMYSLNQFDDALSELEPCVPYFKENNSRAYLNTIHFIGLCYRNMGNYAISSKINQQGIEEGINLGNRKMEVYFHHSEGINQYLKGNYNASIDALEKVIPTIDDRGDFANVTVGHFYLGLSYWALDKFDTAISYLKLVDQSFVDHDYAKLEFLEGYKLLINYHNSLENNINPGYYQDQKTKVTNALLDRNNMLFPKLSEEYDLANVTRKNERYQKRTKLVLISLFICIIFLSVALVYHRFKFNNKGKEKVYSDKTEASAEQNDTINRKVHNSSKIDISIRQKQAIIRQLSDFEKKKKYLAKNINLTRVAADFDTNSQYLSQIVKQEKGKKFAKYINDLKITYLIDLLRSDKVYRNYKIKVLAEECGFSNIHTFIRSFKSKTGQLPSKFLKDLQNEVTDDL